MRYVVYLHRLVFKAQRDKHWQAESCSGEHKNVIGMQNTQKSDCIGGMHVCFLLAFIKLTKEIHETKSGVLLFVKRRSEISSGLNYSMSHFLLKGHTQYVFPRSSQMWNSPALQSLSLRTQGEGVNSHKVCHLLLLFTISRHYCSTRGHDPSLASHPWSLSVV